MGVGVPQVVPDIGGFKEFCTNENSVLVKPKYRFYQPTAHSVVGGEAEVCDPHDICVGIERYLLDSETLKRHGEAARQTVLGFTWDKVCESLVKRLKEAHSDKDD
jgi:glycosyltransferase involved in cell wall biosynthesis